MNYTTPLLATLCFISNSSFCMEKENTIFIPEIFRDLRFFSENGEIQRSFDKKTAYTLAEKHEENVRNNPSKETLQDALTTIAVLLSIEEEDNICELLEKKISLLNLCKQELNKQEEENLIKDMCGTLEYVHRQPQHLRTPNEIIIDLIKPKQDPESLIQLLTKEIEALDVSESYYLEKIKEHEIILENLKKSLLENRRRKATNKLTKGYNSILRKEQEKPTPNWEKELYDALLRIWKNGRMLSQEWNGVKSDNS